MLEKAEKIINDIEATRIHITALHNVANDMRDKLSFAIRYADSNGDYAKISLEEANIYKEILEFLGKMNPMFNAKEERW